MRSIGMRKGGIAALLSVAALMAVGASGAFADDAAVMYDPSTVYAIELDLPQASVEELEEHPTDEYVQGFLTLAPTAGTPGTEGSPLIDNKEVGIRLKGNVGGSFRDLDTGKAAFKIKCNFVSGQKCLGLKKMTLNNMVQDPSMVHETLAYAAFRAAGVPASRTGYAYVRVNGEDFGLYLNLETYDDVFLKREFGAFDDSVQHLYEGELGDDVASGGAEDFEVDEGDEGPGEIGDLEALVEAANGAGDQPWSQRVSATASLAEMARMWAVEKYIDHWDGYSGHAEAGQERPNNYYLYSELSGRFQMLPWGADQTWIPTIGVGTPGREVTFDGSGGILFNKCVEDEACLRTYWEALRQATDTIAALEPDALAEGTAELLEPWQAEEIAHGRSEHNATEIKEGDNGVDETLDFIAGRQAEAEEWLAENVPPPEPTEGKPGGGSSGPGSSHAGSAFHVHIPMPAPPIRAMRTALSAGSITTRFKTPSPGRVRFLVEVRTASGLRRLCRTSREVGSGEVAMSCSLPSGIRHRLRRHRLAFQIRLSFTSTDGMRTTSQHLRLPRDHK